MKKNLSNEQKMAVLSEGGTLLQASAGSGKTFVLVEHVLHKIRGYIEGYDECEESELRSFLNGIVLITFTKKAADELQERILNRFHSLEGSSYKALLINNIDSIFIGTIHSFFLYLLRLRPHSETVISMGMASEFKDKKRFEQLYESWFQLGTNENQHKVEINVHKDEVISSMRSVFNDAGLRNYWDKREEGPSPDRWANDIVKFFELDNIPPLPASSTKKTPSWMIFWNIIKKFCDNPSFESASTLSSELKGTVVRLPKDFDEKWGVRETLEKMKSLRAFIKKIDEDINAIKSSPHDYKKWPEVFDSFYIYCKKNYLKFSGLNYADLELYAYKSSLSPDNQAFGKERFHTIIIDEFQDTSSLQFDTITNFVGGDISKVFGIGDLKQAIYSFRGGELNVFLDSISRFPSFFMLKANYRSNPNIVQYNNDIFYHVLSDLPRRKELKQIPEKSASAEDDNGGVICLETIVPLNEERDDSDISLDDEEAKVIINEIESLRKNLEVAILYRKMGPSVLLAQKLSEKNFSFNLQIRYSLKKDPLVLLSSLILQSERTRRIGDSIEAQEAIFIQAKSVLSYFSKDLDESEWQKTRELFQTDLNNLGGLFAFQKFFLNLGLSILKGGPTLENLFEVIENCYSTNEMDLFLRNFKADTRSMTIKFGPEKASIHIMSVHASKGLEFDHVFLGGIYSNGSTPAMRGLIGNLRHSFRWRPFENSKKTYRSLTYMLEQLIVKKRELAESKRLFYVAMTRAKESLFWVDLRAPDNSFLDGKANSWIKELREHDSGFLKRKKMILPTTHFTTQGRPPLYFDEKMGVMTADHSFKAYLAPELSVTKLSSIFQCPRKFYLENFIQLEGDDTLSVEVKNELPIEKEAITGEEAKLRGIRLHTAIEKGLKGEEEQASYLSPADFLAVRWAIESVQDKLSPGEKIYSEEGLYLKIFGQMISGIPDVFSSNGEEIRIWDFKTGKRSKEQEIRYWGQLKLYALGLTEQFPDINKWTLFINYVDLQESYSLDFLYSDHLELKNNLFNRFLSPLQKEIAHCKSCKFSKFCH